MLVSSSYVSMAFVIFVIYFCALIVALLISTGRVPFDLAEAESELVSGISTELGGITFH